MRNPLEDRVGNNSDGCGRYAEALERFIVSNHEQSLQVHQMNEEREDNKESIAHEKVKDRQDSMVSVLCGHIWR